MSFHGSNVDLDQAHKLAEELVELRHRQDEVLATYKPLVEKKGGIAELEMRLFEAKAIVVIPPETGAQEAERMRKMGSTLEQARLRHAEELKEYCKAALAVLESQVSGVQTRARMLKVQVDMDGSAT